MAQLLAGGGLFMLHAKGTSRRTVKFDALEGNRRGGERKLGRCSAASGRLQVLCEF
jgi:hypothetical protein